MNITFQLFVKIDIDSVFIRLNSYKRSINSVEILTIQTQKTKEKVNDFHDWAIYRLFLFAIVIVKSTL